MGLMVKYELFFAPTGNSTFAVNRWFMNVWSQLRSRTHRDCRPGTRDLGLC